MSFFCFPIKQSETINLSVSFVSACYEIGFTSFRPDKEEKAFNSNEPVALFFFSPKEARSCCEA